MPSYTVEQVLSEREFEGKGGKMKSYDMRLKGVEEDVEWARKPDSDAPEVGKEYPFELSEGFRGKLRAKLESKGGFGGGGNTTNNYNRDFATKEERALSGARQGMSAAYERAILILGPVKEYGGLEEDYRRDLTRWADWIFRQTQAARPE